MPGPFDSYLTEAIRPQQQAVPEYTGYGGTSAGIAHLAASVLDSARKHRLQEFAKKEQERAEDEHMLRLQLDRVDKSNLDEATKSKYSNVILQQLAGKVVKEQGVDKTPQGGILKNIATMFLGQNPKVKPKVDFGFLKEMSFDMADPTKNKFHALNAAEQEFAKIVDEHRNANGGMVSQSQIMDAATKSKLTDAMRGSGTNSPLLGMYMQSAMPDKELSDRKERETFLRNLTSTPPASSTTQPPASMQYPDSEYQPQQTQTDLPPGVQGPPQGPTATARPTQSNVGFSYIEGKSFNPTPVMVQGFRKEVGSGDYEKDVYLLNGKTGDQLQAKRINLGGQSILIDPNNENKIIDPKAMTARGYIERTSIPANWASLDDRRAASETSSSIIDNLQTFDPKTKENLKKQTSTLIASGNLSGANTIINQHMEHDRSELNRRTRDKELAENRALVHSQRMDEKGKTTYFATINGFNGSIEHKRYVDAQSVENASNALYEEAIKSGGKATAPMIGMLTIAVTKAQALMTDMKSSVKDREHQMQINAVIPPITRLQRLSQELKTGSAFNMNDIKAVIDANRIMFNVAKDINNKAAGNALRRFARMYPSYTEEASLSYQELTGDNPSNLFNAPISGGGDAPPGGRPGLGAAKNSDLNKENTAVDAWGRPINTPSSKSETRRKPSLPPL